MEKSNTTFKSEIRMFAGPNGSGKSTITVAESILPPFINADDIKKEKQCGDLEAAQLAAKMRIEAVEHRKSFTFETVLSTDRNILLLEQAKKRGYFIRCSLFIKTMNL